MTTTLTFTDDDGADAVHDAINGWRYRAAYEHVQNVLRSILKHGSPHELDSTTIEYIKEVMHDNHPRNE